MDPGWGLGVRSRRMARQRDVEGRKRRRGKDGGREREREKDRKFVL